MDAEKKLTAREKRGLTNYMLKFHCDVCGNEIDEPGGLAFSPPDGDSVKKYHLCRLCWGGFVRWLKGI